MLFSTKNSTVKKKVLSLHVQLWRHLFGESKRKHLEDNYIEHDNNNNKYTQTR